MNLKLTIIILSGVIFGMLMTVPQFFMSDIIAGGLIFGVVFAIVGWLILRRKQKIEV
jgi:hypothetical protein